MSQSFSYKNITWTLGFNPCVTNSSEQDSTGVGLTEYYMYVWDLLFCYNSTDQDSTGLGLTENYMYVKDLFPCYNSTDKDSAGLDL